jgi:hypothetical protein
MNIDKILLGYLEAALWTEEETILEETGVQIDIDMVTDATKDNIKKDIEKFISLAGETAINEVIDTNGEDYLGHDILLTRNRHGAGFFDRGYENEKVLEDAAHELGEIHIFYQDGEILFE